MIPSQHSQRSALPGAPRLNWTLFVIVFAILVAFFLARTFYTAANVPLIADTDDAMRMVVVRDFLNGQSWFDHTQYRLNTPYGAQMHWSRLVDLPIAGLMLAIGPFAGAMTPTVVAFVWPMMLLFCLLYVSAKLVLRLVGPEGLLPALILPAFSPSIMAEFSPGRLDHHSFQIILTVLIIYCTIEALTRPRFAIGAGIAAATAIAIGTECLPIIAAVVLVFGLLQVFQPERGATVRAFGISFSLATLGHLMLAAPPQDWLAPACDALSIVYALAATGGGLLLVILTLLPTAHYRPTVRLAISAALGGLLLVGMVVLFPQCLKGPYAAIDPWLIEHWISHIVEAEPLWISIKSIPAYVLAVSVPPLIALGVIARILWTSRGLHRAQWLILGLFLVFALVVMLVQIRGGRIAAIIAIPAGCWLIAAARARYLARQKIVDAAGLIGSWLGFAGVALLVTTAGIINLINSGDAVTTEAASGGQALCLQPEAFADLSALPPERIMTPIDLGSHMLLFTPHAVVAAPYHRNQRGVRDAFDFFNLPIESARKILDDRGIGLVVTCPAMPEIDGLADAADTSFVRLAKAGKLPDWLEDVSLPGAALKTYAVLRK